MLPRRFAAFAFHLKPEPRHAGESVRWAGLSQCARLLPSPTRPGSARGPTPIRRPSPTAFRSQVLPPGPWPRQPLARCRRRRDGVTVTVTVTVVRGGGRLGGPWRPEPPSSCGSLARRAGAPGGAGSRGDGSISLKFDPSRAPALNRMWLPWRPINGVRVTARSCHCPWPHAT